MDEALEQRERFGLPLTERKQLLQELGYGLLLDHEVEHGEPLDRPRHPPGHRRSV